MGTTYTTEFDGEETWPRELKFFIDRLIFFLIADLSHVDSVCWETEEAVLLIDKALDHVKLGELGDRGREYISEEILALMAERAS